MFRRNNRDTRGPEQPERFDLGAIQRGRELQRAQTLAAEAAAIPAGVHRLIANTNRNQPNPLAALLSALGPPRPIVALPPVDLVAQHDERLAAMMRDAEHAHGRAYQLAHEWQDNTPGGHAFAAATVGATEDELVSLLAEGNRLWARAIVAQQDADRAEAEVRHYAATNTDLQQRLDESTDALRDEARVLFNKAEADGRRRFYDDAMDVVAEWRVQVSLWRWTMNPDVPYRTPVGRALPAELQWDEHNAGVALGEQRPVMPIEGTVITSGGITREVGDPMP